MLSFGDPTPYTGRIKQAGCKIICQVQTLAQAKEAAGAGADIIIAQGRDAGGHSGTTRGTMGLVPAVVDAVAPIPVVAAGGIADGRGLAAALALGAAGVSMGTRFTAIKRIAVGPGDEGDGAGLGRRSDGADPRVRHRARRGVAGDLSRPRSAQRLLRPMAREEETWPSSRRRWKPPISPLRQTISRSASYGPARASIWSRHPIAREMIERIVDEAASVLRGGAALVRG